MANAQKIVNRCEAVFDDNKDDCNSFAKAVASHFGVTLTGNADAITDQIHSDSWVKLDDGAEAAKKAAEGFLVIGGLKGSDQATPSDNGHVVVVVKGNLEQDKYPKAYWGKLNSSGEKNKSVNYAWRKEDRDNVKYGAKAI